MKSGFVAVVGKPNVGKSTLINALVGRQVSIVTEKPQTTRRRILGVVHGEGHQIVLVDTPGLVKPRNALGRKMTRIIEAEGREADLVLLVVDMTGKPTAADREAYARVAALPVPRLLVANKIDRARKPAQAMPLLAAYGELGEFEEVFPISAAEGTNLELLRAALVARLPEGDPFFPEDMDTDLDTQTWIEEVIREQVLNRTRQEIPHSVAVKVEDMQPGDNPEVLMIRVHLFVERNSQKRILIGSKGALLKEVGQNARELIQEGLGRKVYLDLWVKVKEDWRDREDWLRALGYE